MRKKKRISELLSEDKDLTRKKFLERMAAYSAAMTSLPAFLRMSPDGNSASLNASAPRRATGGFEDRLREKWTWDHAVRGTHNLNCWFQQNCSFHIYTKNGKVVREEQTGDYPQTNAEVPDFNPRGCQKGCTYSELMYSKPRLRHPLKRVGKRGEGKWEEISWDKALTEIADKMIHAICDHGPETVVVDPGGNIVSHVTAYSMFRFFDLIDGTILDVNAELGDDQQGAAVTFGEISADRSGDDYFYADLIFIWAGNPAYTQIPNFHFITEARYNGTEIIAISPDLNASAMHADLWVPVKPGTDSALANAMCHVIIKENLLAEALIKEQTDLPYLVRVDNRKLLRESDIKKGGSDTILYRWDLEKNKLEEPSQNSLALGNVNPALRGTFSVETFEGIVTVKPVFEFLEQQLAGFSPEKASVLCGVAPETIRMLARKLAKSKAATNTCTSCLSKYYHGGQLMRSIILAFVLTGHLGRKGDGFSATSFLVPDGNTNLLYEMEQVKELRLEYGKKYGWDFWRTVFKRKSWNQAVYKYGVDTFAPSRLMTNSTLFWNIHGGLFELTAKSNAWDPYLKRDIKKYLDECIKKNWQVLEPDPKLKPRVYFSWSGNAIRRVRGSQKILETLWPKLDLVVALEMRLSSTAVHADYVLPVSGAYEKTTTAFANSNTVIPFLHTTQKAVENVGESKDEWEIACLLAKKIQERSAALDKTTYKNRRGKMRRLDVIYDYLTFEFEEDEAEKLSKKVVEDSTNLGGATWNEMKEKGYVKFSGLGVNPANWGNATDIKPGQTISHHTWHREKKEPWLTLSGRIQFYVDHDWYLELGEELPLHKNPPKSGGDYPLIITGGHTRWSIHAMWRTDPLLLRLQRGEPCLYISHADAEKRKLKDHDKVKVYNDIGFFITRVKISAKPMPGQVIMYHAWESFQFEGWHSYREVLASPLNPIEMVGDYPYLKPVMAVRQPGQSDRDTRVEIVKVGRARRKPA